MSEALRYFTFTLAKRVRSEVAFFADLRTLSNKNVTLTAEVTRLRGEITYLHEVAQENARLRKQLGLRLTNEKLILARVTGFSLERGSTLLAVDKGGDEGVAADDLVILENYLIGRVERVEANRSLVRLITDPTFSVAALDAASPERPRGIVWGSFGVKLRMEKILPGERVSVGDLIISSGLDGRVPLGFVLGEVTQLVASEGGILKEAELRILFDPGKLEEVFIFKR